MLQILVSTMNQTDYSLLDKMNIICDAVIVNQSDIDYKRNIEHNGNNIIWINSRERGLSKSRNLLLANATSEYCIIADDDEEFDITMIENIKETILNNPEIDIFRFKIKGIETMFKHYPEKEFRINYLKSIKMSSVEIVIKKSSIDRYNIMFDEIIGAGTKYMMGEENSFIFDCIRNNLKIKYFPVYLAKLHIGDSTWFNGYDKRYFVGRGASFTSMSRLLSIFLILQFGFRKYKLYKEEFSLRNAYKYMFKGRREYMKLKEECETIKK